MVSQLYPRSLVAPQGAEEGCLLGQIEGMAAEVQRLQPWGALGILRGQAEVVWHEPAAWGLGT